MQKKLMAVAVAGALAMPGIAAAQSVTVSGFFKIGLEQIKISQPGTARAGLHDSEMRVADNSSRLIFGVNEDLGGGLQAVAQLDFRTPLDNGAVAGTGNDWVGLKSKGMGAITIGRHDLHYGQTPSDIAGKGALKAAAISIMDYIGNASIANTTRTPNSIKWDSPTWGGFSIDAAYSTNAGAASEADLTTSLRKGSAWMLNPSFQGANFKVAYSMWRSKPDAVVSDQKGDNLMAYYVGGGLKIGGAWNKSSIESATTKTERVATMIGGSYSTGPHEIHAHYDVARKIKVGGSEVNDTGAKMMAAAYVYNLSKRTAMSFTYAKITNDQAINYGFFTDGGNGAAGLSSSNANVTNGEDPQLLAVILRHAF